MLFLVVLCSLGLGCAGKSPSKIADNKPVVLEEKPSEEKTEAKNGKENEQSSTSEENPKSIEETKSEESPKSEANANSEENLESKESPKSEENPEDQQKETHTAEPIDAHAETPHTPAVPVKSAESDAPESLSYHEATAVFTGFSRFSPTGTCGGRTANCSNGTCSAYKLYANFQIKRYKRHKRKSPKGEAKQKSVFFQVNALSPGIGKTLNTLTLQDRVRLHWDHIEGDARKAGPGSLGIFQLKRNLKRLECIGTCGKGVKPYQAFQNAETIKNSGVRLHLNMFIGKEGSMESLRKPHHRKKFKALNHAINSYLKKTGMKKKLKVCQLKNLQDGAPIKGKMVGVIQLKENKRTKIRIKKNLKNSKKFDQCVDAVFQGMRSYKHSLPFNGKVFVKLNFF